MSLTTHTHGRWRAAPGRQFATASSLVLGLALLLLSLLLAATHGAYGLGWRDIALGPALWLGLSDADQASAGAQVFWHIRAPRLAMGALAGMALGLAGALIQGLFRNPLADPGLIGVQAGGALGAASVIVLLPVAHPLLGTLLGAFAGSLLCTAIVWLLARRHGQVQVTQLLLVGIAVNALAGSGLGLLTHMASDAQVRALTFWMLGSLAPSHWGHVAWVLPLVLLALPFCLRLAPALNTLALGEAQARLSGVRVNHLQRQCVAWTALIVGAVTAVMGMVGFVGLLAPHAMRLLTGPDHRATLPGSALLGASLVVLADTVARTAFAPVELPLGVLTGLLGAPTFLWLLRGRRSAALH